MNKDKQDATKWPANDEWLVSLDISSNTITQKSGFTPVSKVICICFSFTRVGKVISLFNLKTFTLIVSAHPYYARKFTRHVTFESER